MAITYNKVQYIPRTSDQAHKNPWIKVIPWADLRDYINTSEEEGIDPLTLDEFVEDFILYLEHKD